MTKTQQQSDYVPIYFGKEVASFIKARGQWLLANVNQEIGWPQKKVVIQYRGQKILLLPGTKSVYPAAAVLTKPHSINESKIFLMQFLSALAWYQPGKCQIVEWTNSSTQGALNKYLRKPLAKRSGMTRVFFRPTELPNPKDPNAQRALAFFREGMSINHDGYSFLSFYKIINMKYPEGKKQKTGSGKIYLYSKQFPI